jgi:energy-coupling factor transporter ATP-binding protein EcfA2
VTALTPFQIQQLTARRDSLLPEWELLTEKEKRLRMALVIETDAAVKFKLEQQILAEDEKLSKLAAELAEIEQKLSQAPTFSPPTNNSDPSDRIQQTVKGDGNQIIGQMTGGNVFNIAGDFNILPQNSIDRTTLQVDWLDRSRQLLQAQKHLTTNRLLNKSNRHLDDIHVPLGLIERKERPKVKEEPSPEQGSQLYQTEYTETKRFEHEAFLADVVGKPARGKHIAIIGEPGAGKTTILTKIGAWLIQQAEQQPEEPLVVAWISLASLAEQELSEYLYTNWLISAHPARLLLENWKYELAKLIEQKRVWLLLDGLDEISKSDSLMWLKGQLAGWGQNLRVVMTCRIDRWEVSAGANAMTDSFDVYHTLDYSYQTSQGDDQVKKFISNWFADNEKVSTQIRTELDAPGKERIKDLVTNPLRLTLLCASWDKDKKALPETQADLYRGLVNYLYKWKWKAAEFSDEVKLRKELNLALGKLAKAGLNRQPINDGAVRRFRFTASEISELWADLPDTLLPTAKNLGWLNVVDEESGEAVYAFYHPTFQEYFAAFTIDDWDYFLPRAHIDRPVLCKSGENLYRVFKQEWQQVILFWIGRRADDISDEIKGEFIKRLTDFEGQEGGFYSYQAYLMAAILVGEFKSSEHAKSIAKQLVELAFGCLDLENKWVEWPGSIESSARATIPLTHRQYVTESLQTLYGQYGLENNVRYKVSNALDEIILKKQIVDEDIWKSNYLVYDEPSHFLSSEVSQHQIESAIAFLEQNINYKPFNWREASELKKCLIGFNNPYGAINILGKAVGNEQAIKALIIFLSLNHNPHLDGMQFQAAKALGKIAMKNDKAIENLVDFFQQDNLQYRICFNVRIALNEIVTKAEMPVVIVNIKEYITKEARESNLHRFKNCHMIIFEYAQSLTYPEFYEAWHQHEDPTSLSL